MILPAFKAGGPSAGAGGRWVRLPYLSANQRNGTHGEKPMARTGKKKKPKMDVATRARRASRAALGRPPTERVIKSAKKKKKPKHKKRPRDEDF